MIEKKKILVTGATGQVAGPLAIDLAKRNEVWCVARFSNPDAKKRLESHGIKTHKWVLGSDDFGGLPDDFDYVIHAAADIMPLGNDYDETIRVNAEGAGLLMAHCRKADAFMYVSSLCIYKTPEDSLHLCPERTSPLGSHPVYAPSYSTGKVSAEAVARTLARIYKLPTIITRLGMAYGTSGHGGVPTMIFRQMLAGEPIRVPTKKFAYSLIHEDDLIAHIELLFKAASVPAEIVNWVGDENVDERTMYEYIAKIGGFDAKFVPDDSGGYEGGGLGCSKHRQEITGKNKVEWKEGILSSLKATFPDHKFRDAA